jgi:hypothetical protein
MIANTHVSVAPLQRLYALQRYSLANYAREAQLYAPAPRKRFLDLIKDIARGQRERAAEIRALLAVQRAAPETTSYPLRYTALNYLCARMVARKLLQRQPALIAAIRSVASAPGVSSEVKSLAHRIARAEEANLVRLRRAFESPAAAQPAHSPRVHAARKRPLVTSRHPKHRRVMPWTSSIHPLSSNRRRLPGLTVVD